MKIYEAYDAEQELIQTYCAAMWVALDSGKTKLSKSGQSVIFARPVMGRSDLSGVASVAAAQLQAADINPKSITDEQRAAYQAWQDAKYHKRRIDEARIVVSRIFRAEKGSSLIPVNSVTLKDGWGEVVSQHNIICLEVYRPEAVNMLGQKGAYAAEPDVEKIEAVIKKMREDYPEYVKAEIQDNNEISGSPLGLKDKTSTLHFNAYQKDKAAWVRAANQRGMKLVPWMIEQLNRAANK